MQTSHKSEQLISSKTSDIKLKSDKSKAQIYFSPVSCLNLVVTSPYKSYSLNKVYFTVNPGELVGGKEVVGGRHEVLEQVST